MIDKVDAFREGVEVVFGGEALVRRREALRDKLRALLPSVVNGDGRVDGKALQDVVDVAATRSNNQGYELTFAGKGIARMQADSPSALELRVEAGQSKDFERTGNVVIRGDNLEALRILNQNYYGKVKLAYIDPPYNTLSENFVYGDNFKLSMEELVQGLGMAADMDYIRSVYGTRSHSGWLAFMYPRLKLARELLSEDGVLFVSIDDHEQANLKIMCDEIFGEENHIAQIVVQTNPRGRQLDKHIAKTCEYVCVYGKKFDACRVRQMPKDEKMMGSYNKTDERGGYRLIELRQRASATFNRRTSPTLFFSIYADPKSGGVSLTRDEQFCEECLPLNSRGEEGCWTWSKKKINENLSLLVAHKTKNGDGVWRVFRKDYIPESGAVTKAKSLWTESSINHENGRGRVSDLFGESVFEYPKSVELIKKIIGIGMGDSDVVLDFFAGSGTTADAVMQLNAEDGGRRRFILVQSDEAIGEETPAHAFCTTHGFAPVISSITLERLNRTGRRILAQLEADGRAAVDVGYRVFSTASPPRIADSGEEGGVGVVNLRYSALDTVVNMMCATGQPLDAAIETVVEGRLYKVGNEVFVLGEVSSEVLAPYKGFQLNLDGWADVRLAAFFQMGFHRGHTRVVYGLAAGGEGGGEGKGDLVAGGEGKLDGEV